MAVLQQLLSPVWHACPSPLFSTMHTNTSNCLSQIEKVHISHVVNTTQAKYKVSYYPVCSEPSHIEQIVSVAATDHCWWILGVANE